MGKKILFSPIGTTDPITNFKDGSMLHICRVYKPNIVYLYLSAEMIKYHEDDNRYEYCIKKLAEKLNQDIEIKYIMRPDLHNVQIYDLYYKDFCEIIAEIQKEMLLEDELLVNVASGTPAMKSALMILAALSEYRLRPIQVTTPIRRSNRRNEDIENYEVSTYWGLNEDNEPEFKNRCVEVQIANFMTLMKLENIYKLIESYDYSAALIMAEQVKAWITEEAYKLLELANARIFMNNKKIDNSLAKKYNLIPIQSGDQRSVFEYALSIGIKIKKKEYADFLRALTPLTLELTESILKVQCKIDIAYYCRRDRRGVRRFDLDKLNGTEVYSVLENEFGKFKDEFVNTRQIVPLIRHFSKDQDLNQKAKDIMDIEQKVRNLAAHEIVSVTEDWIEQKTGFKPEKIYNIIKYLVVKAGIKAENDDWNSYDKMNKLIIEKLKIIK